MAQHYPIECFDQKIMKRIRKAIKKDFEKRPIWTIRGSLKYERINEPGFLIGNGHMTGDEIEEAYRVDRNNINEEVWICDRYVGPGFVWNSNRAAFEIHFDKAKRKVTEIYLVA
jgi:hypothetical protein